MSYQQGGYEQQVTFYMMAHWWSSTRLYSYRIPSVPKLHCKNPYALPSTVVQQK
jgi:hypothetical protein